MGEQEKKDATAMDVKKFLNEGQEGNEVTTAEFSEFWKSLSDEEKEDFKKNLP